MPPKKQETGAGGESNLPSQTSDQHNADIAEKVVQGIVGLVDKGAMHTTLARSAIIFALDSILKVDEEVGKEAPKEELQGTRLCRLILQGACKNGIISEDETHADDIAHFAQLALPEAFEPAYQDGQLDEVTILVGVLGLAIQGVLKEGNVPDRLAEYFKNADLTQKKHNTGEQPQQNPISHGDQHAVPPGLRQSARMSSAEEANSQTTTGRIQDDGSGPTAGQKSQKGPPVRQKSWRSSPTSPAFNRACIARLVKEVSGMGPKEETSEEQIFNRAAMSEQIPMSPECNGYETDSALPHTPPCELDESLEEDTLEEQISDHAATSEQKPRPPECNGHNTESPLPHTSPCGLGDSLEEEILKEQIFNRAAMSEQKPTSPECSGHKTESSLPHASPCGLGESTQEGTLEEQIFNHSAISEQKPTSPKCNGQKTESPLPHTSPCGLDDSLEEETLKEQIFNRAAMSEHKPTSTECNNHKTDSASPNTSSPELDESTSPLCANLACSTAEANASAVERSRFAQVMTELKNRSSSQSSKTGVSGREIKTSSPSPSCTHQTSHTDEEEASVTPHNEEEASAVERAQFEKVLEELISKGWSLSLTCIHRTSCTPEVETFVRDEAQYARLMEELDKLPPSMPCIYRAASTAKAAFSTEERACKTKDNRKKLSVSSVYGKTKVNEHTKSQHPSGCCGLLRSSTEQTSASAACLQVQTARCENHKAEYDKKRNLIAQLMKDIRRPHVSCCHERDGEVSRAERYSEQPAATSPPVSSILAHTDDHDVSHRDRQTPASKVSQSQYANVKSCSDQTPLVSGVPEQTPYVPSCTHQTEQKKKSAGKTQTTIVSLQRLAAKTAPEPTQNTGKVPTTFKTETDSHKLEKDKVVTQSPPHNQTSPCTQQSGQGGDETKRHRERKPICQKEIKQALMQLGRCSKASKHTGEKRQWVVDKWQNEIQMAPICTLQSEETSPCRQQSEYASRCTEQWKQTSTTTKDSEEASVHTRSVPLLFFAGNNGKPEFPAKDNKENISTKCEAGSRTSTSTQLSSKITSPRSNCDGKTSVYTKTSGKSSLYSLFDSIVPGSTSSQLTSVDTEQTSTIDEAFLCTALKKQTSPTTGFRYNQHRPLRLKKAEETKPLSRNSEASMPKRKSTQKLVPSQHDDQISVQKFCSQDTATFSQHTESPSLSSLLADSSVPILSCETTSISYKERPTRSPVNSSAVRSHATHRSKHSGNTNVSMCSSGTQTTLRARGKRTSLCSSGTQTTERPRGNRQTPQHSQSESKSPCSPVNLGSAVKERSERPDREQISHSLFTEPTSTHLESGPTLLLFSPSEQTSPTSYSDRTSNYSHHEQTSEHSDGKQASLKHSQQRKKSPVSYGKQASPNNPRQGGQSPVHSQFIGSPPLNAMMLDCSVLGEGEPASLRSQNHSRALLQSGEEKNAQSHQKDPLQSLESNPSPLFHTGEQTLTHTQYSSQMSVCWHGKKISVCQQCSSQISVCPTGHQVRVQSQSSSQASMHTEAWLLQNECTRDQEEEKDSVPGQDSSEQSLRPQTPVQAKNHESMHPKRQQTSPKLQFVVQTFKCSDQNLLHSQGSQTSPRLQYNQASPNFLGKERTPPLLREQISVHLQPSDLTLACSNNEKAPGCSDYSHQLSVHPAGEQTSMHSQIRGLVSMHSKGAQTSVCSQYSGLASMHPKGKAEPKQLQNIEKSSMHSKGHQPSMPSGYSDQASLHSKGARTPTHSLYNGKPLMLSAYSDRVSQRSQGEHVPKHSQFNGESPTLSQFDDKPPTLSNESVGGLSPNCENLNLPTLSSDSIGGVPFHPERIEQPSTHFACSDEVSMYSKGEQVSMHSPYSGLVSMYSRGEQTSMAYSEKPSMHSKGEPISIHSPYSERASYCSKGTSCSENPSSYAKYEQASIHSPYSENLSLHSKEEKTSVRSPYSDDISTYSMAARRSMHSKCDQTLVRSPYSALVSMHSKGQQTSMLSQHSHQPSPKSEPKEQTLSFKSGKEISPTKMFVQSGKDLSPTRIPFQSSKEHRVSETPTFFQDGRERSPKRKTMSSPNRQTFIQAGERKQSKSPQASPRSQKDGQTPTRSPEKRSPSRSPQKGTVSTPPGAFTCRSDLSEQHVNAPGGDLFQLYGNISDGDKYYDRSRAIASEGDTSVRSTKEQLTPCPSGNVTNERKEKTFSMWSPPRGLAINRLIIQFEEQARQAIRRKLSSMERPDNGGAGRAAK